MCSRSRAVAVLSTSWTGSILSIRSSALDALSNTAMSQPNTVRYADVERARPFASGSGRAMARFLGNSSPKSIWMIVDSTSARTVPTATPTPVGTPTPPSMVPSDCPMRGSAT